MADMIQPTQFPNTVTMETNNKKTPNSQICHLRPAELMNRLAFCFAEKIHAKRWANVMRMQIDAWLELNIFALSQTISRENPFERDLFPHIAKLRRLWCNQTTFQGKILIVICILFNSTKQMMECPSTFRMLVNWNCPEFQMIWCNNSNEALSTTMQTHDSTDDCCRNWSVMRDLVCRFPRTQTPCRVFFCLFCAVPILCFIQVDLKRSFTCANPRAFHFCSIFNTKLKQFNAIDQQQQKMREH